MSAYGDNLTKLVTERESIRVFTARGDCLSGTAGGFDGNLIRLINRTGTLEYLINPDQIAYVTVILAEA